MTPLARVLVTHGHVDHAGGAAAVAARMPDARCLKMPWPERDHRWPVPWDTVYIPAGLQGDLAAYLDSLARVLALDPARILPAHGPAIEDPAPLLRGYIAHRLEREAQIVETLRRGGAPLDALVSRVYRGLRADLVPSARETVAAHLAKLEREGRAARRGDTWTIMDG